MSEQLELWLNAFIVSFIITNLLENENGVVDWIYFTQ